MVAIVSFPAPLAGEGAGFLRVLRTLRLLHTYQLLARLRADSAWFRRNEELAITIVHLAVFLFVMTGIVYETQHWNNREIKNYIDALYFTVTALTTTGFGDITLRGTTGRLISVLIMIFGVTLFLRLIRALLQPRKVRFACRPVVCSATTSMPSTAKPAERYSTYPMKGRAYDPAEPVEVATSARWVAASFPSRADAGGCRRSRTCGATSLSQRAAMDGTIRLSNLKYGPEP
jgi:hypothetical protein